MGEDKPLLKLSLQQMSAHLPVLVTQVVHLNAALLPPPETLMQSTQGGIASVHLSPLCFSANSWGINICYIRQSVLNLSRANCNNSHIHTSLNFVLHLLHFDDKLQFM